MTPREFRHERLGRWLLCRVLPSEAADDFLDDLEEEMAHRRQRGSLGLRDRVWFWRQIVSLDVLRLRRELAGRGHARRTLALPGVRTDATYAIRALIRERRLTLAAVGSLALGIGAVSMMFGFIRPFVSAVPPLDDLERVAFVWSTNAARGTSRSVTSLQDFADWRDGNGTFETLAAWQSEDANLSSDADSMRVSVRRVTSGYFPTLGIEAELGRTLQPPDSDPASPRAVVFSQNLWRTSFGADPAVIGRRVSLDGEGAHVVGVMPAGLDTLGGDVWAPLGGVQDSTDRGQRAAFVIGRLRGGVAFEQAGADLARIAGRLEDEYPATNRGWGVRVVPFAEDFLGSELRLVLALLAAASFFVLAIACVNVSNLLLARAEERRHELAMRSALGAGPSRLSALLLIESAVLGVTGGLAGLVVSFGGLRLLRAVFPSEMLPPDTTGFDAVLFALAAGTALVSTLLIGTLPAWRVRRTDVRSILGEGGRAMTGGRSRIQAALVAAQVALSVLLLVITGLMLRTVISLQLVPPGFDARHLVTMRVDLPESEYPHDAQIVRFFDSAIDRIGALPGVVAAGATTRLPIAGSRNNPIRTIIVDARPAEAPGDTPWALDFSVTPGYLQALGVPLVAGRWLAASDVETAQPVAVVSETLASRYWTTGSALGGRLAIGEPGPGAPWITVVGIAGDVRNDDVDQPPLPQIYRPLAQAPKRSMSFLVRTDRDPADIVAAVREEVRAVDARQPLYDVQTMEQILEADTAGGGAFVSVLGVFGGMALLLAAGGILGVASRAAAYRRQEVGIRLALGAGRGHVYRLMIGRGLVAVAIGALFGIAAAFGVTQLMAGVLFGVGPADPLTYGTVLAILVATALAASVGPAMRSLRRDPLRSLRYE